MKNIFKPILFQTAMVSGILNDLKWLTRRTKGLDIINISPNDWSHNYNTRDKKSSTFKFKNLVNKEKDIDIKCPYSVGDILWVRETSLKLMEEHLEGRDSNIYYKTEHLPIINSFLREHKYKWTPSIHMLKTRCRLFLKVKNVRLERLHEISVEDAIGEGIEKARWSPGWKHYTEPSKYLKDQFYGATHGAVISFLSLWMKINGKESLDSNPWVWVIEFERIEKPLDFI